MPPIEYAIVGSALCWRYKGTAGKWRVCSPADLTNIVAELRGQLGLTPYPKMPEETESIAPWGDEY